ncbi:MAG: GldG family protein [Nitrosomonas sp.]|nr:MAG: GldG family protein [Nitrosomonas sp.]
MTVPSEKLRLYACMQRIIFAVLVIGVVLLLGYLATLYRMQWDVSQNGRNSLSEASVEILQKLHGPIRITAYATEQHAELGDIRKIIADFISLYQRVKPDISLAFVDPVAQPHLAQTANVQVNGEVIISFNRKTEHLTSINEQAFSNALVRLARTERKLILEWSGHGERKLNGRASFDLGDFGQHLQIAGFDTQPVNWGVDRDIPVNADLLLIASPQIDLLPGEVDQLLAYIERGGNLLWLIDQEPLRGLLPLVERLRLTLTPGIVIDPQAETLNAPNTFALGALYGQHAITQNFDFLTVFPFARQLIINENEEWRSVPLVEAAPQGWIEGGDWHAEIAFDQTDDVPGPVVIAAALTRAVQDREQRVAVIGSGYFLANAYLGNGGNLDFGMNVINWLAGDEALITVQPRATMDNVLVINQLQLTSIAVVSSLLMPLAFLIIGVAIWWRRKHNPK